MKFNNKSYQEAKKYLIEEGVFSEEYSERTTNTKIVADANKRYLDATFKPTPIPKRKDNKKVGQQCVRRKNRFNTNVCKVNIPRWLYHVIIKEIPQGEVSKIATKMMILAYLNLRKPKMGCATLLKSDWDLKKITNKEYEEMVEALREKNPVIKDNPFI